MLKDDIKSIEEKEIQIKTDWYYHAFRFNDFEKIVKEGICCAVLTKKNHYNTNGPFYISLSKKEDGSMRSAFSFYREYYPMFILDNVRAYYCKPSKFRKYFINTRIPLRTSNLYDDEYHAYWQVPFDKVIGIQAQLYIWSAYKEHREKLKAIYDLLLLMEEYKLSLPLYDYSFATNSVVHEVDKEKYIRLMKGL